MGDDQKVCQIRTHKNRESDVLGRTVQEQPNMECNWHWYNPNGKKKQFCPFLHFAACESRRAIEIARQTKGRLQAYNPKCYFLAPLGVSFVSYAHGHSTQQVFSETESDIRALVIQASVILGLIMVSLVCVTVGFARFLSKGLTQPVIQLVDVVRNLNNMDFSRQVSCSRLAIAAAPVHTLSTQYWYNFRAHFIDSRGLETFHPDTDFMQ